MSKQRSTQSTSGRSSQSSTSRATTTTENQPQTGGQSGVQSTAQGGSVVEQTKQKAQELSSQVQQKASQRVESGLTRGKTQAAEKLNTVAQSLIFTGQQLRERNEEPLSRFVDQAVDRVQRVSNYLQNTDVSEIVDSTEQFARRRPALFLGGAFVLGLLGARFLKSSRRQQTAGGGQWAAGGAGSGRGYSRERSGGVDQEVPTPRPQQEWAAGGAELTGLADVTPAGVPTQPLGESGFGRQRGPLDYGAPPSGPDASQRF